jgi:hypothetical protein
MGLFDYLGVDSPMFIPTQRQSSGFNINLAALVQTPQVPSLPATGTGSSSEFKWNDADSREREVSEAQAREVMGDLVKKYGSDINAITKDANYKQALNLMYINPEEIRIRENRKDTDDKTIATLHEKGNEQLSAFDYKTWAATGSNQTIGDTFNSYLQTSTSKLPDYQEKYNTLLSTGTTKDLNDYIDSKLKNLTGKSPNEIGQGERLKTYGNAYALQHKEAGTNNLEQVKALATDMANSMDEKSLEALKGEYAKLSGVAPDYDDLSPQMKAKHLQAYMNAHPDMKLDEAQDALRNELSSRFNQYKQQRILQAIVPKEEMTPDKTVTTRMGNWITDEKQKKELQQSGQLGSWLATSPVPNKDGSVSPAAAKPTKILNSYQINVTDKDGNIVRRTINGKFDVFTGPQYNYSFGKDGIPIEAMTRPSSEGANDEVYFGGKWQSLDNFKGLKIMKAVGASNLPTEANFSADDFDEEGKLKKSSQWKVNGNKGDGIQHYIDAEVVIPESEIKNYAANIEVNDYDEKQTEPLLNSLPHRIINFGTDEFNDAAKGLLNRDKDGNIHLIVKVRTPNAEALNAMDKSSEKGIDKNSYSITEGTEMNNEE